MVEFVFLVAFLLLQNCVITPGYASHRHERLVLKIIHYESVNSPFYNPNFTPDDRVKRMNERSETRISDLMTVSNYLKKDADEIQIKPAYTSQFLVPLKIGTPPVEQLLTMDTGSLLLWVHCGYTIGGELSQAPLYDNAKSSTYAEDVYCGTPMCDLMTLRGRCGKLSKICEYFVIYGKGKSKGHLASEVVSFQETNGTEVIIKRLIFGCSMYSYGADGCSGILGLGQRGVSFLSQQNYTGFSYCIGNIYDVEYDSNTLILGGKPIVEGESTPMFMIIGKYYITLERISVGDKFIDIDPNTFKRVDLKGGMLVDTGASSTYLPTIAFKKLKEEIRSVIGTTLEEYKSHRNPEGLCYHGVVTRDLQGLPTIAFHFAENAKMELTAENLFHQSKAHDHFCLSVRDSETQNLPFSILGVWAQQFFYIAFDFNSMRMFFTRIDCDRLLD
ncbi:aspartic proteinase CDR1-like [Lycium ferocissimum]|uniref:aspartic proteinase CDR1-like n=1 Tax=Lycium ferocissimum TaxID=112874 RepID=UPI002814E74F|nr:aspartic proteinase CDR1-like [Lycium ferocissimum]